VKCRWEKQQMESSDLPVLTFVYEGIADEKVGITTRMAKELERAGLPSPAGITLLRLKAPSVIGYVPGVVRRSGGGPHCETSQPGFAASRMIWIVVLPDELLVHYCESELHSICSSHLLQVRDRQLPRLAEAYLEELQYAAVEGEAASQGVLLALVKRLRRQLAASPAPLSNSSYPATSHLVSRARQRASIMCERAIQYIDLHLRDALTWEHLAEQLQVSPFYLNRVFRSVTGMTVMRYVSVRRIEAAQQMLIDRLERIGDIAQLTGFASPASFSNSFKKHVGCTPNEFRRRSPGGE
jgi:AraC-like DNA-binding protein